jgi:hypothetical protein
MQVHGDVLDNQTEVTVDLKASSMRSAAKNIYKPTVPGDKFSVDVKLFPGDNLITASTATGLHEILAKLNIKKPSLRVQLSWAGNDQDYDLHVNHVTDVYYGRPSADGGVLDHDWTDNEDEGNPIENISYSSAAAGLYRVYVVYYTDNADPEGYPQETTIRIYVNEKLIHSDSYTITQPDGWLDGDGESVWNVGTIVLHAADQVGGYAADSSKRLDVTDQGALKGISPRTTCSVTELTGPDAGNPVYLIIGESVQFTASGIVNYGSGNDQSGEIIEKFTNSDPSVGIIGPLGVFTASAVGHTQISATTYSGSPIDVYVLKVDFIEASSTVADNSPQQFEGEVEHPFDPTIGVLDGGPGQHLVIFYKDVIDSSFNIQDFDIDLSVEVLPASITSADLDELWHKATPPWSGSFNRTDSFNVKYQNPKEGGNYKIDFHNYFGLGSSVDIKSEANITLPLAGAEVDSIIQADIVRADAFATHVIANYSWRERQSIKNGNYWFYYNGAGDYTGRPDNSNNQTVRLYNQVRGNEDPDNEEWGFGAIGTWKGKPIRVAKCSNFMIGYAARKIGVNLVSAWFSQLKGSFNDSSATKSWNAGWDIAEGASYDSTVMALVADIWDEADEKNQKLWPNSALPSNYVVPDSFSDPDNQFTSPGFLYMTNP